jgi:hypothetical protein
MPKTETVNPLFLELFLRRLLLKAEESGDQHCDCHCCSEHQDQHGSVLLCCTTDASLFGFKSVWRRRSQAIYSAEIERPLTELFSEFSGWRAGTGDLRLANRVCDAQ